MTCFAAPEHLARCGATGPAWVPCCALAVALAAASSSTRAQDADALQVAAADRVSLADLSLEQLGDIEVVSVSRRPEPLQRAAASVFVISAEDIRRSGATSVPEVLRLAPNLEVARASSAQYSISARGFKDALGNKLLVLLDGRTIYSPLSSGVFWDAQDVVLEDIERIEVISGPGGTLWGSNAVNGVINITTRSAQQTQGTLAWAGAGDRETGAVARYGGADASGGHYRVYLKSIDRGSLLRADGSAALDDYRRTQAGFRSDRPHAGGTLTVQGDAYSAVTQRTDPANARVDGLNLLARWTRGFDDGSNTRLQVYYDRASRLDPGTLDDDLRTLDLEFQHGSALSPTQQLLWGIGHREAVDSIASGPIVFFLPAEKHLRWNHVFVQDELALRRNLSLSLGSKWESNVYTGNEFLPSAKLAWSVDKDQLLWSALSRAVRAPSRIDRDFSIPLLHIVGGPNFQSEVARVLEVGYRAQPATTWSYSVTAFRHLYDRLRSGQPFTPAVTPPAIPVTQFQVVNMIAGSTTGAEGWATWQPMPAWRLSAGLLEMRQRLHLEPGSLDPTGPSALGNDPKYQATLRLAWNPHAQHQVDVMARRVGALPQPAVPAYTAVDLHWGWRVDDRMELSLTGQNLLDPLHRESGAATDGTYLDRRIFVKAMWQQ